LGSGKGAPVARCPACRLSPQPPAPRGGGHAFKCGERAPGRRATVPFVQDHRLIYALNAAGTTRLYTPTHTHTHAHTHTHRPLHPRSPATAVGWPWRVVRRGRRSAAAGAAAPRSLRPSRSRSPSLGASPRRRGLLVSSAASGWTPGTSSSHKTKEMALYWVHFGVHGPVPNVNFFIDENPRDFALIGHAKAKRVQICQESLRREYC